MVSSLTAIRFQVNDLNDQTAAPSRDGKWRNEHQHGWYVGWLEGWMPDCGDGWVDLFAHFFLLGKWVADVQKTSTNRQLVVRAI